jgi:hypothetical protein
MPEQYKPGDKVPKSGIYKVIHDPNHDEEHEVTCIIGAPFPPCSFGIFQRDSHTEKETLPTSAGAKSISAPIRCYVGITSRLWRLACREPPC